MKKISRIKLDTKIGEWLIKTLYDSYINQRHIFIVENTETAPQNVYKPKDGSHLFFDDRQAVMKIAEEDGVAFLHMQREHFSGNELIPRILIPNSEEEKLWHFFSTSTDRRQVSAHVYLAHFHLYQKYPELYTRDVIQIPQGEVARRFKECKLGLPNESSGYWIRTAKTLFEEFDGDPVNIFNRCGNSVDGVIKFKASRNVDPLPGLGPKITSLIALFLCEIGAIPFPEDAFAVDMHVMRIFQHVNVIWLDKSMTNDDLEKELRPFICKIRRKYKMDPVALAHSFWLLGRSVCTRCYARKDAPVLCPIWNKCGGLINAKDYYKTRTWQPTSAVVRQRKGGEVNFGIENLPLFTQK